MSSPGGGHYIRFPRQCALLTDSSWRRRVSVTYSVSHLPAAVINRLRA